ncbi:MAG: ATP-dependent Clp protease proteolytic subunit [Candidatus Izemoplasmatales bacterium]
MENAVLKIDEPISRSRILFFNKQVDQDSIGQLSKEIIEINNYDDYMEKLWSINDFQYKRHPIKIYIDSYGGFVYQCFGLISIMESSKTEIETYITGTAMSCGFMISICGHKRFCYKLSTPMYHQVSSGLFGTIKQMEDEIVEVKRLQNKLEEIVLRKTKISQEQLKKIYKKKKDWYMTPNEALELGVVDEII